MIGTDESCTFRFSVNTKPFEKIEIWSIFGGLFQLYLYKFITFYASILAYNTGLCKFEPNRPSSFRTRFRFTQRQQRSLRSFRPKIVRNTNVETPCMQYINYLKTTENM